MMRLALHYFFSTSFEHNIMRNAIMPKGVAISLLSTIKKRLNIIDSP